MPVMLNWQIASAMLARMTLSFALHMHLNKCCGSVLVDGREWYASRRRMVKLIKWVQEQAGVGSARVRAPRLELQGEELAQARAVFEAAMAERPAVRSRPIAEFKGA